MTARPEEKETRAACAGEPSSSRSAEFTRPCSGIAAPASRARVANRTVEAREVDMAFSIPVLAPGIDAGIGED